MLDCYEVMLCLEDIGSNVHCEEVIILMYKVSPSFPLVPMKKIKNARKYAP